MLLKLDFCDFAQILIFFIWIYGILRLRLQTLSGGKAVPKGNLQLRSLSEFCYAKRLRRRISLRFSNDKILRALSCWACGIFEFLLRIPLCGTALPTCKVSPVETSHPFVTYCFFVQFYFRYRFVDNENPIGRAKLVFRRKIRCSEWRPPTFCHVERA